MLQAAIAGGKDEPEMSPLVFKMNEYNAQYKEAAKHVRMHTVAPKAAPKQKAAAAKCKSKAGSAA